MKTSVIDNLLRCPKCKRGVLPLPPADDRNVRCRVCAAAYPVSGGVIDLLPGVAVPRSPAQLTMEWEPIVRIYESRLWRRSPWATLAMGISFERERELILRAAALGKADTVLDLAGGPGIYARPFARTVRAGIVVLLDLSRPMLIYANRRAREEKLDNIVPVHGTALELPFPPDSFDLVNCCGALHLFPDVPRVVGEVHRVLKPGGRFTVAAFRRRSGALAAFGSALRHRLTGIDAFSPDELEARLVKAGLRTVHCHHARGVWLIMSARKSRT